MITLPAWLAAFVVVAALLAVLAGGWLGAVLLFCGRTGRSPVPTITRRRTDDPQTPGLPRGKEIKS